MYLSLSLTSFLLVSLCLLLLGGEEQLLQTAVEPKLHHVACSLAGMPWITPEAKPRMFATTGGSTTSAAAGTYGRKA